jgi:hypothetical protein
MKGSAAMLGATSVARSCAELIQNARHGSLDDGAAILGRLDGNVAAIRQTLAPRVPFDAVTKAPAGSSE